MTSKEMLEHHTRDALKHLFNPARLQTHPLGDLVLSQGTPERTRAQALRQVILDEIEHLRPDSAIPYGQPEWLPYRTLRMHHVEGQGVDVICHEIGLGRTSFYRYYRQARESLASLLWERHVRIMQKVSLDVEDDASLDAQALQEALRVATTTRRERVEPAEILGDACHLVASYAARRGVSVTLEMETLPDVYAERGILRQAFVNLLTESVNLARVSRLAVRASVNDNTFTIILEGLDPACAAEALETHGSLALCQALINVYGGQMWLGPGDAGSTLYLTLPCERPKTILIVDDDADTAQLYRRYLAAADYAVRVWDRQGELLQTLAAIKPDLVLLDMLMPEPDGWRVLQEITASLDWGDIPIVVCSVLNQPDLALSLGATRVLQKPIAQGVLLQTMREVLHPQSATE